MLPEPMPLPQSVIEITSSEDEGRGTDAPALGRRRQTGKRQRSNDEVYLVDRGAPDADSSSDIEVLSTTFARGAGASIRDQENQRRANQLQQDLDQVQGRLAQVESESQCQLCRERFRQPCM